MSWRQSTGKDVCLSCRHQIGLGAPIYVGELTPATWCLECAQSELGRSPDGPVPKFAGSTAFAHFDIKAMGAKLRAAIIEKRTRERDGRMAATGDKE